MEFLLQVAGALLIANGLGHALMPRILGWRTGFASLSRLDRQISYVHVYFIGLGCVTWGLFALIAAPELAHPETRLDRLVLVGGAVFCLSRLVVQFVFEPVLWRNRRFGTAAFVASAFWWAGETAAFTLPLFGG